MSGRPAYGGLDRLLHNVAFSRTLHGIDLQKTLSDVEDSVFARGLPAEPPPKPVFVAALPRAGTTLLLSLIATLPEFASHTYRDMPFVLCPMLWNRISRTFRKPSDVHERAHGDGVMVGYDSPEAFEEVLWMAFWRDKYLEDSITPWTPADRDPEFESFFARHMHKVIAVRAMAGDGRMPNRYLSKNNANIARLPMLPRLFPDCRIVVPLRDPWSHAQSLHRQHERFSEIHAEDAFARRYMAWLGHFEFGAELRPIRFAGWPEDGRRAGPTTIDFWVRYWIAAHEAILAAAGPNLIVVDYATLCADPRPTLEALADALDVDDQDALTARAEGIRRPTAYAAPDEGHDPALRRRAAELYDAVRRICINYPPALHRTPHSAA